MVVYLAGFNHCNLARAGRRAPNFHLWYICSRSDYSHSLGREKKVNMDLFHRKLEGKSKDTPSGRDCQFCYRVDPDFAKRDPMDRLVLSMLDDTAAAHLTEDGYVKHRIAELLTKRAETRLAKSA
jgi:hypothetical protein